MNVTKIDYFSLDVEGAELGVLETVPFDKLHIKVLSVEFLHAPNGKDGLRRLMTSKGYSVFGEVRAWKNFANDFIFVHNSMNLDFLKMAGKSNKKNTTKPI